MNPVWILAWSLSIIIVISDQSDPVSSEKKERSLKKRQLDFDGGGGGVNEYINGDDADYREHSRDKIDRKDEHYGGWSTVSVI